MFTRRIEVHLDHIQGTTSALMGDYAISRLCERILEVCHCPSPSGSSDGDAMSYDVSAGNFTKQFVAFRFDDRGNRLVTLDSAKNGGMHGHHGAAAASAASRINGSSATRDVIS